MIPARFRHLSGLVVPFDGDNPISSGGLNGDVPGGRCLRSKKGNMQEEPKPKQPNKEEVRELEREYEHVFRRRKEEVERKKRIARLRDSKAQSRPIDKVLKGLSRSDCTYEETSPRQWMAQCPTHDDDEPSLAVTVDKEDDS